MYRSDPYFESYISKTYYKTAAMISIGCRGLGVLLELDTEAQRNLFDFGAHLGIAFQVHDDILDFTQSGEMLGKPSFNDLKEVSIRFYISLGYHHCPNNLRVTSVVRH
jgi:geranylgeranyl pyrophosphate synthase